MKVNRHYLILVLISFAIAIIFIASAKIFTIDTTGATILTGIVLAITFVVLAYEIILENEESKNLAYERLRTDFMHASLAVMSHPEINDFLYHQKKDDGKDPNYSRNRKMTISYLDAIFGLFERAWKDQKNKKMEKEWKCWKAWLVDLSYSEGFDNVHTENVNHENIYDEGFIKELNEIKRKRGPI